MNCHAWTRRIGGGWLCVQLAMTTACQPTAPTGSDSAAPDAPQQSTANAGTAAPTSPAPPAAGSTPAASPAPTPPPATTANPPAAPPAPKPAAPGLSGRGTGFGNTHTGAALSARIRIEERVILDNVTYALKLFEAEHGRRPESHEEFMQKIIQANSIQLPTLPEGQKYAYDPDKGELMVQQSQ